MGAVAAGDVFLAQGGKMLQRRSNGRTERCAMGGLVAVCLCWGARSAAPWPLQCALTQARRTPLTRRRMGGLQGAAVASAQNGNCGACCAA